MIRRTPTSPLTTTLFPYTPLFRSVLPGLPPPVYAASRYLLAALTLMLVLALRGGLQPPRRQDLPGLAALGVVGITLMQLLWTNALDLTTAAKGDRKSVV